MPPSSKSSKAVKKDALVKNKETVDMDKDIQMKTEGLKPGSKRGAQLVESDSDLSAGSAGGATPDHRPPASADQHFNDKFNEKFEKLFDLVSGSTKRMEELAGTIKEHQNSNDNHFHTMRNSFTDAIEKVTDKIEASDISNQAKFLEMEAKIKVVSDRFDGPASSSRPSSTAPVSHRAPLPAARAGPQEDCLVFIRGFPTTQPGFILKKYATEAIAILTDADKLLVRLRIPPADTQFSMVFPSSSMAASFVENYRALDMVFADADKNETPLTCRTGKPLALRRRGGLIMPVYSALEGILRTMPSFSNASISQSSKTKMGKMNTEFFALVGSKLTPLFRLEFQETPDEMTISQVVLPVGGSALSSDDFDLIVKAASSK
jgi:hypothetical protein